MKTLNFKTKNAKTLKNKTAMILLTTLLVLSMFAAFKPTLGQVYPPPGTHIASYENINVAPNPIGVGQTVSIDMFLTTPLETSGNALTTDRPQGITLTVTDPNGKVQTLGPFTGDATGGTSTNFVPSIVGNYTFQSHYPGQTLTGNNGTSTPPGWGGLITDPSDSPVVTLIVQEQPIVQGYYAYTPLPTSWWETPVTAENVQNWYAITGPWLGLSANSFASTGTYNSTTVCNPYTVDVTSGHVIWTLPWGPGGVAGGIQGGTESSNYWTTRQYSPNFAPVVINGILYSTQFTDGLSTGNNNGIVAVNLFTGQIQFIINTTNALRCGDIFFYKNVNQYGVMGPYLWTTGTLPASDTGGNFIAGPGQSSSYANTTGTQWNLYDGFDGRYILSIVNGTALTLSQDDQGGLVGYWINSTLGSQNTHPVQTAPGVFSTVKVTTTGPHLDMFNFTTALTTGVGLNLQPNRNTIINWVTGVQWQMPVATNISGVPISPALAINGVTSNEVVLTGGWVHGQGVGSENAGWIVVSGMDYLTGNQLMLKNLTQTDTSVLLPWTRESVNYGGGDIFMADNYNYAVVAYDLTTGTKLWQTTLTATGGSSISKYDAFNFKGQYANGIEIFIGFGGDIWGVNATTGQQMWYTSTDQILGSPGLETPYGVWPLWVFACQAQSADIEYLAIGHEYDPPLFHGAQLLALNMTNGNLVWSELGFDTRSVEISYGVLITNNGYDNQIYAYDKGPTDITVSAPQIGVTTATPVTVTGTITDVSPGASQDAVKRDFPNGVPAVSDASQSLWMEYVYQQQPMPTNATGVPITLSVLDANNNYRTIGTTTSTSLGTFSFTWTPDISGDYTLYANFAGSNSYYASSAAAGFHASLPTQASATPTTQTNLATTGDLMTYVLASAIAIIIVIAIVGVLIVMMVRKRA